ncbi:MAG: hypothetical protein JO107_10320 [Hyphomicrobiales bacterium]|nr:hypothetical protein [Hyphomicrobiales bacterium]MBV8663485.1 hypothetical protein [Hyphomicrobiales bacterium]
MSIARAIGYRWFERGPRYWEMRFTWAELTGRFGLAAALINWGDGERWSLQLHLGWPSIFIKLPFLPPREPKDDMMDKWGFSVCTDSWAEIHLNWGAKTKIVAMPWQWAFIRRSTLAPDGRQWIHELAASRIPRDKPPLGTPNVDWWFFKDAPRWTATLPYRYVLKTGEVQERQATIGMEESEWRWRWFKWCPFPRKVVRAIDVTFDEEVGERTGSWKGGVLGCGYTMRRDETPEECLYRMQSERIFR